MLPIAETKVPRGEKTSKTNPKMYDSITETAKILIEDENSKFTRSSETGKTFFAVVAEEEKFKKLRF